MICQFAVRVGRLVQDIEHCRCRGAVWIVDPICLCWDRWPTVLVSRACSGLWVSTVCCLFVSLAWESCHKIFNCPMFVSNRIPVRNASQCAVRVGRLVHPNRAL